MLSEPLEAILECDVGAGPGFRYLHPYTRSTHDYLYMSCNRLRYTYRGGMESFGIHIYVKMNAIL